MAQKPTIIAVLLSALLTALLSQAGCALAPGSLGPNGTEARSTAPADRTAKTGPAAKRTIRDEPTREEAEIFHAVDAEICTSYRGWRQQGNPLREHMEEWCPTEP